MRPSFLSVLSLVALALAGAGAGCGAQTNAVREALDPDGDGVLAPEDCDSADPAVGVLFWYPDADGDGFGDGDEAQRGCEPPEGAVSVADDCDDAEEASFPGADERCDGADNDCDGTIDDDAIDPETWWVDADGDGFGDPASQPQEGCEAPEPSGWASSDEDCDDEDITSFPGAPLVCDDGADNDCDGLADCGVEFTGEQETSSSEASVLGEEVEDNLGEVLLGGLDLSGDGLPDLAVSAPGVLDASDDPTGAVYVFFGPVAPDSSPVGANVALLGIAPAGEDYQVRVALAGGDLDGDGQADLVLGAPSAGFGEAGAVYVISGPLTEDMDIASGVGISTHRGEVDGDEAGRAVALLPGDGAEAPLLVVGAPGAYGGDGVVYLVSDDLTGSWLLSDAVKLVGDSDSVTSSSLGRQVASAGDVDGDGKADLLIREPRYTRDVEKQSCVYLILDASSVSTGVAAAAADLSLCDSRTDSQLGASLAAGDLDGSGSVSLLIGDDGGEENAVHAVRGGSSFDTSTTDVAENDQVVAVIAPGEEMGFGASVAILGDVGGDGQVAVAVGAPSDGEGAAYVYYAPLVGTMGVDLDEHGASCRIFDSDVSADLGEALSAAGDANGAGGLDLWVGAPDGSVGGAAYLFTSERF